MEDKNTEMYSLSNYDINELIPGSFMLYDKFNKIKNINKFMPVNSGKIFLIRDNENSGHYICLYRKSLNTYYFCNSFGYGIDEQMKKYISKKDNDLFNSGGDDLSRLLKNKKVEVLNLPLQNVETNVCGRFCVYFLKVFNEGATLNEAVKILKFLKKEMNMSYDELMVNLIKL